MRRIEACSRDWAREAVGGLQLLEPGRFTHDAAEQALLWKIRQGLYPSVEPARKRGTTVIIEDVVFPIDRLAGRTVEADSRRRTARLRGGDRLWPCQRREPAPHDHTILQHTGRGGSRFYARCRRLSAWWCGQYDGALKGEHGPGATSRPSSKPSGAPRATP